MFEFLRENTEEGVVRNSEGRIVETDWPNTPHSQHKKAYKEIAESLKEQVKFELQLREKNKNGPYPHGEIGVYQTKGVTFYTGSQLLANELQSELAQKMNEEETDSPKNIRLCDLGGGSGLLLAGNVGRYKEQNPQKNTQEKTLTTVLTTLIHHDSRTLKEVQEAGKIDSIRTMAIELPHDDFYHYFDIIICQNSVFHWSDYPELTTLNLWKMLRENGVVIANIPHSAKDIHGKLFNVREFLENSKLFDMEVVPSYRSGGALKVILRKKE